MQLKRNKFYTRIATGCQILLLLAVCVVVTPVFSAAGEQNYRFDANPVQHSWAEAAYELTGEAQRAAFEALLSSVSDAREQHSSVAELWVWEGKILISYAGVVKGLEGLEMVKRARESLEYSLTLESNALRETAHSLLGMLYSRVPGWPIAFGNKAIAESHFEQALEINPDNRDANYFFARYLIEKGEHSTARRILERALSAPVSEDTLLADTGRQREIRKELDRLLDQS